MKVRTEFNYLPEVDSFKSGVSFADSPSLAQQHMRDETDINLLVAKFARIGVPPAPDAPAFFDAGDVFDFQAAMNQVRAAQESFMAMPSEVRARFSNDPGLLMSFLADEANRDEAIRLGLISPPPTPTPTPAPESPPAAE